MESERHFEMTIRLLLVNTSQKSLAKVPLMIESTNTLKIGTWNLCLGLANKKDIVTQCLRALNIKICCLQETEILSNFPVNILNCGNYTVELENEIEKLKSFKRDPKQSR